MLWLDFFDEERECVTASLAAAEDAANAKTGVSSPLVAAAAAAWCSDTLSRFAGRVEEEAAPAVYTPPADDEDGGGVVTDMCTDAEAEPMHP